VPPLVATTVSPLPGTGDWDRLALRQIDLMIHGLGPTAPAPGSPAD